MAKPLTDAERKKLEAIRNKHIEKGTLDLHGPRFSGFVTLKPKYQAKHKATAQEQEPQNASGKRWKDLPVGLDTPAPWEINSDFRRFSK